MLTLSPPPLLNGNTEAQVKQMRTYLYQMAEQLNVAINAIDSKSVVSENKSSKTKETAEEYTNLKTLITKTADEVNKQIVVINGQLSDNAETIEGVASMVQSEYVAKSEYGTWQENISNQLASTSDSITNAYTYIAQLEANISSANASFANYVVETEGFIKTGIVEWSEDGAVPILGVAVGQNLVYQEVTIEGQTYAEIDKTNFLATFTSQSLKFWQDNQVVAYISNNKLYITNAEIVGNLIVGDFSVSSNKTTGFVIKYTGE